MIPSEQALAARREYGVKVRTKLGDLFLACFFLLGCGFIPFHWVLHPSFPDSIADEWYGLFLVFFGLSIGLPALADLMASRLILDGTRVVIRDFFSSRSAEMSEIEGFRKSSGHFFSCCTLHLRDNRVPIRVTSVFDTDDDFWAWLQQFPDLDERDHERRANEKVARSKQEGPSIASADPEVRARHIYVFLNILSLIAVAGLWWGPNDLWLFFEVILVLLPVAVWFLLKRQPLYFALYKRRLDDRYELTFILWFTFIGALYQVEKLDGYTRFVSLGLPFLIVASIALICVTAFARCTALARHPIVAASILVIGGLSFGYGAIFNFDILPDHSRSTSYVVAVNPSQITPAGRERKELSLPPWGPVRTPARLKLDIATSREIVAAGHICLNLRPGFLHMPWYEAKPCSLNPATSAP